MAIDKASLYGCFQESLQRREKLAELATRKALDLPVESEEMQITHTNTQVGLNWSHLLTAGLLMLLSAGSTAGGMLLLSNFLQPTTPPSPSPTTTFHQQDLAAQEYVVEFWTDDGKAIEVGGRKSEPGSRNENTPP